MSSNPTASPSQAPLATSTDRGRARAQPPTRRIERLGVPLMLTVPEAAETLRTTPDALRARLRRAQVVGSDGSVTATLAPGIVGMKMGSNTWRVRFAAT